MELEPQQPTNNNNEHPLDKYKVYIQALYNKYDETQLSDLPMEVVTNAEIHPRDVKAMNIDPSIT